MHIASEDDLTPGLEIEKTYGLPNYFFADQINYGLSFLFLNCQNGLTQV